MFWRCYNQYWTFVVLSLAVLLLSPAPCAPADILQTSMLIEFNEADFQAAVVSAKKESALASIATSTVGRAIGHRPRVAAAAAGIPAAASLANSIVNNAKASRIRIRKYQSYGVVFNGMALEAETPEEADALRRWLRANRKVKKIYPVYMVELPTYIPPTQSHQSHTQKDARAALPAAALPTAAAAAGRSNGRHGFEPLAAAAAAIQGAAAAVATDRKRSAAAAVDTDPAKSNILSSSSSSSSHRSEAARAESPAARATAAAAAAAGPITVAALAQQNQTIVVGASTAAAAVHNNRKTATGPNAVIGSTAATTAAAVQSNQTVTTDSGSNDVAAAVKAPPAAAATAAAAAQQNQTVSADDDHTSSSGAAAADPRGTAAAAATPKSRTAAAGARRRQARRRAAAKRAAVAPGAAAKRAAAAPGAAAPGAAAAAAKRAAQAAAKPQAVSPRKHNQSDVRASDDITPTQHPLDLLLLQLQQQWHQQRQQQQRRRQQRRPGPAIRHRKRGAGSSGSSGSSGSGGSSTVVAPDTEITVKPGIPQDTAAATNGSRSSSSSKFNNTVKARNAKLRGIIARSGSDNNGSSSSSDDPTLQQQQQQQQYEITTDLPRSPAAAAPRVLPPARSFKVPEEDDHDFGSSSGGGGSSSSDPAAPPQPQAPPPGSSRQQQQQRPRADNTVPYLVRTEQIGGIDSSVRLPLGPGGSDVHFTPNMEWASADLLTGVTELRTNFKLTGKGIRIGIIDTGIDYTHPAFGTCTAINEPVGRCRVVAGKDLVGDEFMNGRDVPKPDNDPRDCHNSSHGTTVAGIAAAGWYPGAQMLGVAPEASLGIYKVFGCRGSAPTSAIIGAIQQAVLDGMDVINLSLSLGPGFPADPYASVMKRVYDLGILATKSAGNQGTISGQGLFWVDAFTGAGSITVGSADTSTGIPGELVAADYSTYGPDGNLNLVPQVSSPGSNILTTTFANSGDGYTVISGTSHATPYLAGGLALLLQLHRETERRGAFEMVEAWKPVMALEEMNQKSLMDALITTATPITSDYDPVVPSAVSKSGAGLVNFASAYFNPIEVSPSYIALPSNMTAVHMVVVTIRNHLPSVGPGRPEEQTYTFIASHRGPAMAVIISDEWGMSPMRLKDGFGAHVTITPDIFTIGPEETVNITVTFRLPDYMSQRPWLYSGYIDLRPYVTTKLEPPPPPPNSVQTSQIRGGPGRRGGSQRRGGPNRPRGAAMVRSAAVVPPDPEWESGSRVTATSGGRDNHTMRLNGTVRSKKGPNDSDVSKAPTVRAVWSPDDRWTQIWRYDQEESPMPPPRPLVIPYQGSSRNYSTLPIVPRSTSDLDALTPGLCYAPGDDNANVNYPEYAMDIAYDVNECQVNTADYWTTQPIQIPLADLRDRPCDLRITLSPQLPVKRVDLQLLNRRGQTLGYLPPINTPVFARAPAYSSSYDGTTKGYQKMLAVYTYCLSWGGRYKPVTNDNVTNTNNMASNGGSGDGGEGVKLPSVVVGQTYSLVALLEAPTAKGDEGLLQEPVRVRIPIRGRFTVVTRPSISRRSRRLLGQQQQGQHKWWQWWR